MQRSEFLRTTTVAGVGALCGATCISTILTACSSTKYIDGVQADRTVMVPLSAFPVDANSVSSVIVRKSGAMMGPIHIVRNPDKTYTALSLVCTHKACIVRPVGTGFECPCHGSEFSSEGAVLSPPAKDPLVRYAVSLVGEQLRIQL